MSFLEEKTIQNECKNGNNIRSSISCIIFLVIRKIINLGILQIPRLYILNLSTLLVS